MGQERLTMSDLRSSSKSICEEGNMETQKICPFMSNGNSQVYCSTECKLNTHSPLNECVFEIMAKELLVIDNGVNEIQETLRCMRFGTED